MDKKKIISSLITIGAAGALLVGATFAFFSDNETSTGNTFTAGTLDLKVDSECHYFQDGQEVQDGCQGFGNWEQTDLGAEKFFNFDDIKPGDWGEDTISLHVVDNDAWGQFKIGNITDNGELGANMEFWLWLDQGNVAGFQCSGEGEDAACTDDPQEGDNVRQENEPILITPGSVDSQGETHNIWDGLAAAQNINGGDSEGILDDGRMVGSINYYFGLAWCFGKANPSAEAPAGVCDGSGVSNDAQGDTLSGDLSFLVTQHRNNPDKEPLVP
jgi:predicted ribosomally synthesized peptide with SipW-like signal peptide